jgi:hypothetical protein
MGQTSWITNAKGEEEYVDKGAITMPTPSVQGRKQYMEAEAAAKAADKVEWPTKVAGQTEQGM